MNAGSSLGSALAPPLVAFIGLNYGWRAAFVATGAAGVLWLIVWAWLYYTPKEVYERPEAKVPRRSMREIFREPACWSLCFARFLTDPVIYFVIFWLPEYLGKERGFDLAMIGRYAWVPFLFGDVGYLLGGWLSGRLMDKGWTLGKARRSVMYIGASVMPAAIFAPLAPGFELAIAAICVMAMGHAMWVSNVQSIPADTFAPQEVATASGLTGMGGAIGGMLANLGTGWVVQHYGYSPVFFVAGLMHPLAAFSISRFLGRKVIA
jgi:ACS family hexuronate transporter-like MFS transporter